MDDFLTPPLLIETLTPWGYVGYTILGLVGLAVLAVAALVVNTSAGGYIVALIGAMLLYPTALAYFRTVPSGWNLPNLLVWGGLIAAGALCAIAVHLALTRTSGYSHGGVLLPVGGVLVAAILAALYDYASERLAVIPMSWGLVVVLVVLGVLFVMNAARSR